MDLTVTIFSSLSGLGGAVIFYLFNRVNTLENQVKELKKENQKLENLLTGFMNSFVLIQANKPAEERTEIDKKILELVAQTQSNLNKISNIEI